MFKRGENLTNNIIGIAMAAIGILVLIFLMVSLFSPIFNKVDKTSESYFNSFEKALNSADSGATSYFSMMNTKGKTVFYLVYFGGVSTFGKFIYLGAGKNIICVCSVGEKKTTCKHCKDVDLPIDYISSGHQSIPWAIKEGVRLEIRKNGGHYEFREK